MNLLDTNIITDSPQERQREVGAISIMPLVEALRGIDPKKRAKVKELLEESFSLLNLDGKVNETYCGLSELRKEGLPVPNPGLPIAATAISHDMSSRTRYEHAKRLKTLGLKLAQTSIKLENQKRIFFRNYASRTLHLPNLEYAGTYHSLCRISHPRKVDVEIWLRKSLLSRFSE